MSKFSKSLCSDIILNSRASGSFLNEWCNISFETGNLSILHLLPLAELIFVIFMFEETKLLL